jgi:cytochrome c oxidase subunit 2
MTFSHGLARMFDLPGMALTAQTSESFWLPPPDSKTAGAESVDQLFYVILGIATFFFVLIVTLMVLFVILYRRRPGRAAAEAPTHNTLLEIIWTVIPLALIVMIYYWGFTGYMDMRFPPREAYEIDVVARQWSWQFTYVNGFSSDEDPPILHVPAGQPVRLIMRSEDVIHSLSIPDFRVKMDLVPGRYTKTWFHAKQPGTHDLYCTEYCGTGHSNMITLVKAHTPGEFEAWLANAAAGVEALDPAERGRRLYVIRGCVDCHSIDGTAKTGPSFKGIWGRTHRFSNASPAPVDENYIRESIVDPSAKVREGYEDKMNSYQGQLTDEQIGFLIEFIQSLK